MIRFLLLLLGRLGVGRLDAAFWLLGGIVSRGVGDGGVLMLGAGRVAVGWEGRGLVRRRREVVSKGAGMAMALGVRKREVKRMRLRMEKERGEGIALSGVVGFCGVQL